MSDYRLYRLNADDRIIAVVTFEGADDEAAIAEAIRIDHAAIIEIWCEARKVARVNPNFKRID